MSIQDGYGECLHCGALAGELMVVSAETLARLSFDGKPLPHVPAYRDGDARELFEQADAGLRAEFEAELEAKRNEDDRQALLYWLRERGNRQRIAERIKAMPGTTDGPGIGEPHDYYHLASVSDETLARLTLDGRRLPEQPGKRVLAEADPATRAEFDAHRLEDAPYRYFDWAEEHQRV